MQNSRFTAGSLRSRSNANQSDGEDSFFGGRTRSQSRNAQDVIAIPRGFLRDNHQRIYSNKIVIIFECEFSAIQAREWIDEFNRESAFYLTYVDELLHAIFVAQVGFALNDTLKKEILETPVLWALNRFAAINDYYKDFNPCTHPNLLHLATVHIDKGDPEIYAAIRFIVGHIGKKIWADIESGAKQHRISAIVLTSLRIFPVTGNVQLLKPGVTTINFDYSGPNLRCFHCFSYRHAVADCPSATASIGGRNTGLNQQRGRGSERRDRANNSTLSLTAACEGASGSRGQPNQEGTFGSFGRGGELGYSNIVARRINQERSIDTSAAGGSVGRASLAAGTSRAVQDNSRRLEDVTRKEGLNVGNISSRGPREEVVRVCPYSEGGEASRNSRKRKETPVGSINDVPACKIRKVGPGELNHTEPGGPTQDTEAVSNKRATVDLQAGGSKGHQQQSVSKGTRIDPVHGSSRETVTPRTKLKQQARNVQRQVWQEKKKTGEGLNLTSQGYLNLGDPVAESAHSALNGRVTGERLWGELFPESAQQDPRTQEDEGLSCTVEENRIKLQKALQQSPSIVESVMHSTSLVHSTDAEDEGRLQYCAAQVFELAFGTTECKMRGYSSSRAFLGEGDARVNAGDYERALGSYENGLVLDSEDPELLSRRCFVRARLGDFEKALDDANTYIELGENRQLGLQERGILKRMTGDLNGALTDLNEALSLVTNDNESLKHRGFVKFLMSDEDGTRADAENAMKTSTAGGLPKFRFEHKAYLGTSSVEYLGYKVT